MLSKKNDTSWIASGLRADGEGVGVMAVNVEAVAGDTFGVSTLLMVGLLGAGINYLDDTRDSRHRFRVYARLCARPSVTCI